MNSLALVKQRLTERAGLDPGLLDREWFERIIQRRLRDLGLDDSRAYCQRLDQDAGELQHLVEQISVSETWFFRYPESFELLRRHLTALRTAAGSPERLRMLSVACATGQEPYSMAMTAVQAGWPRDAVILDAADRNENAILAAGQALYARRALRDDAPDWALRWFQQEGKQIRVDRKIRDTVRWIVADVLQPPLFAFQDRYDVIFCRNLLIYLNPPARGQLLDKLSAWLSADGLLFVGHAERIELLRPRFQFVEAPHTFALRAREPGQPPPSELGVSNGSPHTERAVETVPKPPAAKRIRAARRELEPAVPRDGTASRSAASRGRQRRTRDRLDREPIAADAKQPQHETENPALRRASALADSGDLDGALAAVLAVIQTQPPSAEAFALLGSVHLAQGNLPLARKALIKSLYLDARCEQTLLQMAAVYQGLDDHHQAARYRRRAATIHRAAGPEGSG